jgi:outer membrane protein insertion porin family
MRCLRWICLLLALGASGGAYAAGAPVRVIGTSAITTERARAIRESAGFPRASGLDALRESYLRNGYLLIAFEVIQQADSSWTVLVSEGDRARIGDAAVGGVVTRSPQEVLQELGLVRDAPFEPVRLEQRIEALLSHYDATGYPFAQVWVDSIGLDPDSNRVNISLYVVEGTPREITGVTVEGLKKTRPELARRIAGVEPDTPYRAQVLEDMYLRLVASRVFSDVSYPTVRLAPDGKGVDAVVTVVEPVRSHSFAAALGYASADNAAAGSSDRVLSGLVQLELNNIGGTLKDFGATWNNDGNGRSDTRIRYRDRLFLGRRLGVGVKLAQTGQDTLYTWQSLGVEVERGFGRVAGTLMSMSVSAFGDRNVFSTGSLLRSSRVRGRLGLTGLWGSERRATYLRAGGAGTLASKHVNYREGFSGPGEIAQVIWEANAEAIVPAFWSMHYSLLGSFQTLQSAEVSVPLSEQFVIGGASTVRGYRENQFHGRRTAYLRNELRLGRSAWDGLYVFVDGGYVLQELTHSDGSVYDAGKGLAGFGFGVRSASPLGRIDLSFAVGDEISLQATKVHVLLEQNF